jgi:hypothetical protein
MENYIMAFFSQYAFRFRNDEGDNNDDTGWKAALNTSVNLAAGDTKFRLRFLVSLAEQFVSVDPYMGLYYSLNEGAWTYLDNSDEAFQSDPIMHAVLSDVVGYTAESDTTPLLGGTDPVEHTDNNGIVERTLGSDSAESDWVGDAGQGNGDSQAEFEWCLVLREGFVSIGDSIQIRVYADDASFGGSYDEQAFITVVANGVDNALKIKGSALRLKGSSLTIK